MLRLPLDDQSSITVVEYPNQNTGYYHFCYSEAELLAKFVLQGWSNIAFNGRLLPFTEENAVMTMTERPEFAEIVKEAGRSVWRHYARVITKVGEALAWELEWAGHMEVLERSNSKTWRERPILPEHLMWYKEAFWDLCQGRKEGMTGVNPLDTADISSYINIMGIVNPPLFLKVIRKCDTIYRQHHMKPQGDSHEQSSKT